MPNVVDLLSQHNIKLASIRPGQHAIPCPRCSANRKSHHRKLKCLSVFVTDDDFAYWNCHHCGWTGPHEGEGVAFEYGHNRKIKANGGYEWQHRSPVNGEWLPKSNAPIALLYRLEEALESDGPILVVEGEKDVNTLWAIGYAAVCGAHGAGVWTEKHSKALLGRDLVVLNDNDPAGYEYAKKVMECSHGIARSLRRLDLKDWWPEIGYGQDVTDWLERGGSAEWLERIIADLPLINGEDSHPPTEGSNLTLRMEWDDIAYDGQPVPEQQWTVRDRIPARQVCLFTGHGSTGKSTIALQLCVGHVLGSDWLYSMPELGQRSSSTAKTTRTLYGAG